MTNMTYLPDLDVVASGGLTFALRHWQRVLPGKQLLLFFYPRDHTPGCTCEAEAFRDLYRDFLALGIAVMGASRDTLRSHDRFITKLQLPYPLIADTDERVCEALALIKHKTMYGKPVRGIERSSFLVEQGGAILQSWRGVKAEGHAQSLLAELTAAS